MAGIKVASTNHAFFWKQIFCRCVIALYSKYFPFERQKKRNTECGGIEYDRDIGALQQVDLIINMIDCHFFVLVV